MEESQNITNLVIDPFEQKMYFIYGKIVTWANFDGSEKQMIYESGVIAFALDSVERRMYWVDDYYRILKGNMNFSEGNIVYDFYRNNLAIDPYSRLVTHFLKTHTLSETCMGESKLRKIAAIV